MIFEELIPQKLQNISAQAEITVRKDYLCKRAVGPHSMSLPKYGSYAACISDALVLQHPLFAAP